MQLWLKNDFLVKNNSVGSRFEFNQIHERMLLIYGMSIEYNGKLVVETHKSNFGRCFGIECSQYWKKR